MRSIRTWQALSLGNLYQLQNAMRRIRILIWYTDPAKPAKCQSVNANANHYHLDSGDLTHIPKSSEDFAVCYHYAYGITPEVLQRCNTLLHFITL